jgi:hypothetical protein
MEEIEKTLLNAEEGIGRWLVGSTVKQLIRLV